MPNNMVVVWRVTERCNLSCPFCAYDRTLNRVRREASVERVLDFGKILRDAHRLTRRDILVSWLGGEPFLWRPLLDVSHTFKHEFGLRVAVTTNGLALRSKNIREHVVADFDQITVSIDDMGIAHDRLRGSKGLFDELRISIKQLANLADQKSSPLLIRVNVVLMHKNIRTFELLCEELALWGVTEVTFNALGGRDRPEFFPVHRLQADDATWFATELPRIRGNMALRGVIIRGNDAYLERIMMSTRNEMFRVDDCSPGREFLFVDENGFAAPCHFTVDGYGFPIHELHSPADLAALPSFFQAGKRRAMLSPCQDCRSTQVFGKFNGQLSKVSESP